MTTEEYGTTEILKQNALASQLAALNKQLAQKEQYAENLTDQEDKLRQIRIDYEVKLQDMETQMKSLEREKGDLVQKNRAEPASSKIAEQRRKRIQELEGITSGPKKNYSTRLNSPNWLLLLFYEIFHFKIRSPKGPTAAKN